MEAKDIILKALKVLYRKLTKKQFNDPICELDRQKVNDIIYNLLIDDKPCMISRYGNTELGTVLNYICINSNESMYKKILNYIIDNTELPWWDEVHLKPMQEWSGVFPISFKLCDAFSARYIDDTQLIDVLGSHNYKEKFIPFPKNFKNVHLEALYPFFVDRPWTKALEGKKVLVVHPFAETIKEQYNIREKLFENQDILPQFKIITLKAVQSIADEKVDFADWFEALNYMETEIKRIDFDICILGCGAYGLPLAATIKRMGKKSFHMGGGVQLLFGIKGKRWENGSYVWTYKTSKQLDINYEKLYNIYWTRPSTNEKPKNAEKVEGACYW